MMGLYVGTEHGYMNTFSAIIYNNKPHHPND